MARYRFVHNSQFVQTEFSQIVVVVLQPLPWPRHTHTHTHWTEVRKIKYPSLWHVGLHYVTFLLLQFLLLFRSFSLMRQKYSFRFSLFPIRWIDDIFDSFSPANSKDDQIYWNNRFFLMANQGVTFYFSRFPTAIQEIGKNHVTMDENIHFIIVGLMNANQKRND